MRRTRSYPAQELRSRRRAWLTRYRLPVTLVAVGTMAVGLLVTFLARPSESWSWRAYYLGALHVALAAIVLHLLNTMFLAHDQAAIRQLRGALGEDNTRDELRRAARRRAIWDWVDSVNLQAGDLDHVVITRHGGVLVIDSKWRNEVNRADVENMTRSARRAATRAEALFASVLRAERGAKHRRRASPVKVTPLVVLWGRARSTVPDDFHIDGVRVIDGMSLRTYLGSLEGHEITRPEAREAVSALEAFRAKSTG